MPFTEVAEYLERELANPLVQADPKLRMRLLVVKGNIDLEIDPPASRRDWEEVPAIVQSENDKRWESRAKGELGVVAFVEGDSAKAKDLVAGALLSAFTSDDVAAQIRYLTLVGEAMVELSRPEDGLRYLDKAVAIAAANPDVSFPMLAHTGKAIALVRLNRRAEALQALNEALARARKGHIADYEAELLVQLGKLHARADERQEAVNDFEEAARIAAQAHVYRIEANGPPRIGQAVRGRIGTRQGRECRRSSARRHPEGRRQVFGAASLGRAEQHAARQLAAFDSRSPVVPLPVGLSISRVAGGTDVVSPRRVKNLQRSIHHLIDARVQQVGIDVHADVWRNALSFQALTA